MLNGDKEGKLTDLQYFSLIFLIDLRGNFYYIVQYSNFCRKIPIGYVLKSADVRIGWFKLPKVLISILPPLYLLPIPMNEILNEK